MGGVFHNPFVPSHLCVFACFSGSFGTVDLATMAILSNVISFAYRFPLGISAAACTAIGNSLGEGNVVKARTTALAALAIAVGMALVYGLALLVLRFRVPKLYTSDEAVIEFSASLLPLVVVYLLLDALQLVAQGVLRGAGKQSAGALVSAVSFNAVVIPAAVVLGLVLQLRQWGLWLGTLLGYTTMCVLFCVLIVRLDWPGASARAIELTGQDGSVRATAVLPATTSSSSSSSSSCRSRGVMTSMVRGTARAAAVGCDGSGVEVVEVGGDGEDGDSEHLPLTATG